MNTEILKKDNILGCFFSVTRNASDTTEKDPICENFRKFLWDTNGFGEKIKELKHEKYGKDIVLILLQFNVKPLPHTLEHLREIENYRSKEKAIGINIIIEENFFSKNNAERIEFMKDIIIEKLDLLKTRITKNKLDTNVDLLKQDLEVLLT